MAGLAVVPMMSMDVHLEPETNLSHRLYRDEPTARGPWVVVQLGDYSGGVGVFVRDLGVLTALGDAVERARQDLAEALGLLPNGEPCMVVDAFGSLEWNEHDHDRCLAELVDEPVPFVPVVASGPGTAWERHDDPTVEDNPLDDDDSDDDGHDDEPDDDNDDSWMGNHPGGRLLRAEGFV